MAIYKGKHKYFLKTLDKSVDNNKVCLALPNSLARVEASGGVRFCALLLCLAVARDVPVDDVDCGWCGMPHVDRLEHFVPHVKHNCSNCA